MKILSKCNVEKRNSFVLTKKPYVLKNSNYSMKISSKCNVEKEIHLCRQKNPVFVKNLEVKLSYKCANVIYKWYLGSICLFLDGRLMN